MSRLENNIPGSKNLPPDDWKSRLVWPLIRDGSRDDFKTRESSESNPVNYVVEIFPKINSIQTIIKTEISQGRRVSGLIDLRTNNEGKYTIWLGRDHLYLMGTAAQIPPEDTNTSQYFISIEIKREKEGKNVYVIRDTVGQSCKRTSEQIKKILDAVDVALKSTFKT